MGKNIIHLGDSAELIIDEPERVSNIERALILTEAVVKEFSEASAIAPSLREGSLPIWIGGTLFRVYYQIRIKRIITSLTAYSEAIRHIENNEHLYDKRLAKRAITVLRECHLRGLR